MTERITIDAPDSVTVLAARHLDETEGRCQIGATVNPFDRSAINHVLGYIARAHSASEASPVEICELPHESIEEEDECDRQRLATPVSRDQIIAAIKASPFDELRSAGHALNGPLQITVKVDDLADTLLRRLTVTPCGPPPDSCDPGGEPCATHEREQAHLEGDHVFCGDECAMATPDFLKRTLTRAIFALKSLPDTGSAHYEAGYDTGLDAAIDAVAKVFDDMP